MQLEVGKIVEGKVSGITKFGAFVDLGEGKTGMVHISEVAAAFVQEIKDYVKEGETVKVKILSIGEDGKIALSMKQALPQSQQRPPPPGLCPPGGAAPGRSPRGRSPLRRRASHRRSPPGRVWRRPLRRLQAPQRQTPHL